MSAATVVKLPPRKNPVLGADPTARQGTPSDPSKALMNRDWYLALQDLVDALNKIGSGFTAGGDLSGTSTEQIVIGLQTVPIDPTAPSSGQFLGFNGTKWIPTTPSTTPGAVQIDYHTISGAFTIHASVMPAPTNGALVVALTMASGAVQPVWSTDFSISPGAISVAVGTHTNVLFVADGSGKWMMAAPPVTNR